MAQAAALFNPGEEALNAFRRFLGNCVETIDAGRDGALQRPAALYRLAEAQPFYVPGENGLLTGITRIETDIKDMQMQNNQFVWPKTLLNYIGRILSVIVSLWTDRLRKPSSVRGDLNAALYRNSFQPTTQLMGFFPYSARLVLFFNDLEVLAAKLVAAKVSPKAVLGAATAFFEDPANSEVLLHGLERGARRYLVGGEVFA